MDDDEAVHALLRSAFERAQVPFDYDFMSSAGGALSMMNTFCYDAVVLDFKLPDFVGGSVAAEIRGKYPRLPLAYLTNYSDEEMVREAHRLNVHLWPAKLTLMGDIPRLLALVAALVEESPCEERPDEGTGGHPVMIKLTGGAADRPPEGVPERRRRTPRPQADTGQRRRAADAGSHPFLRMPPCLEGTLLTPAARRPSFIRH